MKITDGWTEGRKVVQRWKEDRSCIEGYFGYNPPFKIFHPLLRLWWPEKIHSFQLFSSLLWVCFGLSAAKTCLLWLQRWTPERQGGGAGS